MFNAQRLLGTMIGTGLGGRSHHPVHGGHPTGAGSSGGLMGAIGSLIGGRGTRRGGIGRGVGGGLAAGGIAMVLGQLAMRYMQTRGQGQPEPAAGAADGADGAIGDDQALRMIRAMIASANADGRIDQDERQRILGRIGEAGASDDDRRFLEREMETPASIDTLVQGVHDPEEKAEIYAAALMAVDADTEAERSFLKELADRLGLPPQDRAELHQDLGVPDFR